MVVSVLNLVSIGSPVLLTPESSRQALVIIMLVTNSGKEGISIEFLAVSLAVEAPVA